MLRKQFFGLTCGLVVAMGGLVSADQPARDQTPFRTAEYSSDSDVQIVEVRNGRRYRRSGRYYAPRYYSPYRNPPRYYNYRPYSNRYYNPRYYRPNPYGYYNYGGSVRIGPLGVYW